MHHSGRHTWLLYADEPVYPVRVGMDMKTLLFAALPRCSPRVLTNSVIYAQEQQRYLIYPVRDMYVRKPSDGRDAFAFRWSSETQQQRGVSSKSSAPSLATRRRLAMEEGQPTILQAAFGEVLDFWCVLSPPRYK